jgi:methylenetetrahydrofolate dehydrogenase (NADP+)/methenyltetrahydrofolate cyclohydrolase
LNILNGKELSENKMQLLQKEIQDFITKTNHTPSLAVILVGEDKASEIYVNMKAKACKKTGIDSVVCKLDKNITQEKLLAIIDDFNNDKNIDGILVQLPLPEGFNEEQVLEKILPNKDVDGFSAINTGALWSDIYKNTFLAPATPLGIINLLKHYNIDMKSKNVVIVGTSNIIGKPLAGLFLKENATITMCNIYTKDLTSHTKNADILCVGIGKPKFITKDMIKENAIVIDIGTTIVDNKLYGDIDFENVKDKVSHITPVPGGVGPMTICTLLENTLRASKNNH